MMEKCLFAEATHEDSVVHHFKMNGLLIIAFLFFTVGRFLWSGIKREESEKDCNS